MVTDPFRLQQSQHSCPFSLIQRRIVKQAEKVGAVRGGSDIILRYRREYIDN
jgi:hypothetical protein